MKGILKATGLVALMLLLFACSNGLEVMLVPANNDAKTEFGTGWLAERLEAAGYRVCIGCNPDSAGPARQIVVGLETDSLMQICRGEKSPWPGDQKTEVPRPAGKEGFAIESAGKRILIRGEDYSGTLYGCIELAGRIEREGRLPRHISMADGPDMVIRGTCVGLQKTQYLPGRKVYEYPYTPENFPWFYDRQLWTEYLDLLVANRYNALFLWNGHPFASLVRLKDYPYAVEVDDETFRLNEEIFGFLTREAEQRGITVVQMFYNIILSKPFAEKNGLETQDRSRPITPLIADYTRKSVAAFIEKYPNVGLMVTLGEAMNTIEDDVIWFTETIIPGVKDGLAALGRTDEPPIVLRGHDTDAKRVMEAALPLYKNLYTTYKYNGESLTTCQPRNSWAEIPRELSTLGSVHIANVHIMANLEPFRYGSPDFIQKCVKAMHDIQGASGLHLYPQASYWDWPYSADRVDGRLLQVKRDWVWYEAWGRYAWKRDRPKEGETKFWTGEFDRYYGCRGCGRQILEAYEQTGEIAPMLLRRFGISDGNRQTLLLGMFMSQLVNPFKWNVYRSFLESNGPPGEILPEYARKEWQGIPHEGETPPQIVREVLEHSELAVEAIEKAKPHVTRNREEFLRLLNDVYCYRDIARFFAAKANAAISVLRYQHSGNLADLEAALPLLEESVEVYRDLAGRTDSTYLYANSMQTAQRRIPISGRNGSNKTWGELLVHYENELENFRRNLDMLRSAATGSPEAGSAGARSQGPQLETLRPVHVELMDKNLSYYPLSGKGRIYTDRDFTIDSIAAELAEMQGILLSYERQVGEGTLIRFRNEIPVKILVGFFNGHSYRILDPPSLETDASANDRGQADIRIANALRITGLYAVNVNTYYFEPGENSLRLGKGIALVLGFMDGGQEIPTHDAGISTGVKGEQPVDWLFY
jgi:hypothetical protein